MTLTLAQIWRHPIKAHGFEALDRVEVIAGRTLPWDRTWAVAHEAAKKVDGSEWATCNNFSRGAKAPHLMAISARFDADTNRLTLSHPTYGDHSFDPDDDADLDGFLAWTRPMIPEDRAQSARIVRVPGRGMTDANFPSISLAGLGTVRALSERVGQPLDTRRFRINFWVEGLEPWEEFNWVGRDIRIGDVMFRVEDRITRCLSTAANPETGQRDADTLGALKSGWGHQDLGVQLRALRSGDLALGDSVSP